MTGCSTEVACPAIGYSHTLEVQIESTRAKQIDWVQICTDEPGLIIASVPDEVREEPFVPVPPDSGFTSSNPTGSPTVGQASGTASSSGDPTSDDVRCSAAPPSAGANGEFSATPYSFASPKRNDDTWAFVLWGTPDHVTARAFAAGALVTEQQNSLRWEPVKDTGKCPGPARATTTVT